MDIFSYPALMIPIRAAVFFLVRRCRKRVVEGVACGRRRSGGGAKEEEDEGVMLFVSVLELSCFVLWLQSSDEMKIPLDVFTWNI